MIEFIPVTTCCLALLCRIESITMYHAASACTNIVKARHIIVRSRTRPRLRELALSRAQKGLCDLDKLLLAFLIGKSDLAVLLLRTVFECGFFERWRELQNVFKRRFLLAFCLVW